MKENNFLNTYNEDNSRICALAWNDTELVSSGQDHTILYRDIRNQTNNVQRLKGHCDEICDLRWDSSNIRLASAASDNEVLIWDKRQMLYPILRYSNAAIKAIAWHPRRSGLLTAGSGSKYGCI
jgi:WD40 repeat protein